MFKWRLKHVSKKVENGGEESVPMYVEEPLHRDNPSGFGASHQRQMAKSIAGFSHGFRGNGAEFSFVNRNPVQTVVNAPLEDDSDILVINEVEQNMVEKIHVMDSDVSLIPKRVLDSMTLNSRMGEIDINSHDLFTELKSYFCIFCSETFTSRDSTKDHLKKHLKVINYCANCDRFDEEGIEECKSKHQEIRKEDAKTVEGWLDLHLHQICTFIDTSADWLYMNDAEKVLYTGCPVCEKIIKNCNIPEVFRKNTHKFSAPQFIRHCREHLSYAPFACLKCNLFTSYDRIGMKQHLSSEHKLSYNKKIVAHRKIEKIEQYIMFLAIFRDAKLKVVTNNHGIQVNIKRKSATVEKPTYIKCLHCGGKFCVKREYVAHHAEVHAKEARYCQTRTKKFYSSFVKII